MGTGAPSSSTSALPQRGYRPHPSHIVNRMRNEKRLPWSTFESTRSWPPSCSTLRATTARPRPRPGGVLVLHCADSTCSNSRKMLSSLLAGIPQPVSPTIISTAICFEFLRPSCSLNARHETVIVPRCVYFTGGNAVRAPYKSERRVPYEHSP